MASDSTLMKRAVRTRVHLPLALREEAGGAASLEVACASVGEAIEAVCAAHPTLRRHIFDESGAPRPHVNLFVNDTDVRAREGLATPLTVDDVVHIVPSIAGG